MSLLICGELTLYAFIEARSFEDNIRPSHEMRCELLNNCLVDMVFFAEVKAFQDIVGISTHCINQSNLDFVVFVNKSRCNAIALKAFYHRFQSSAIFKTRNGESGNGTRNGTRNEKSRNKKGRNL